MTYFGTKLRYLRKQDELTQADLAAKLGVAKSTICMYESGNREPDFETVEKIADFFNVPMSTFFADSTPAETNDAEVVRLLQEMRDDLRGLLDVQIDMTPDQVKSMMDYAKFLKGQGND